MNQRRNHAVRYKYFHVFRHSKTGRWMVYYRPPGGIEIDGQKKSALSLYSDPARPSAEKIRDLYERHVRNAEPVLQAPGAIAHEAGTWNAAVDAYMASSDYASLARPGSYTAAISFLREKAGRFPMRKFQPYHVEELLDGVIRAGKPGAYNTLLVIVRKAEAVGRKRGWLAIDLTKGLKKRAVTGEHRAWLPHEPAKWRAAYPDHASVERLTFELIYELGARGRSDATRLSWADTTIAEDGTLWISYTQQKTKRLGKRAVVTRPIVDPDLLACLKHCPKNGPTVGLNGLSTTPWIRNPHTGGDMTPDTFSAWWRKWADAAGMAPDFRPHGARKSLASDATDFEVTGEDGRKLTGHSREVWEHYQHHHDAKVSAERAARKIAAGRAQRRTA